MSSANLGDKRHSWICDAEVIRQSDHCLYNLFFTTGKYAGMPETGQILVRLTHLDSETG